MNSGIYKITSPTYRIYIGQSKDLKRRVSEYRNMDVKLKSQTRLYNSLQKYGWENHQFDIIEYCIEEDLDCSERFWQDIFEVTGKMGLNCILQECGAKRREFSEEMLLKRSESMKGELNPMFGVKRPKEWGENHSIFLKEMFADPNYINPLKGRKMSDKQREILLASNLGRKASEETKQKMRDSHKGRIVDEIGRRNLSDSKLGEKNPMFSQFGIDNVNSKIIIDTSNGDIIYGVSELSRKTNISKSRLTSMLNGYSLNNTSYLFLEVINDFCNYFKNKEIEMLNKFTEEELEILRNNPTSYLIKTCPKLYRKYKVFNPDNKIFTVVRISEEDVITEMKKYKSFKELREKNEPLKQIIYKRFNHLKNYYNNLEPNS